MPSKAGKIAAGVDGVGGVAVGLLVGGEEVGLVLDDRAAERGAVLLALVVGCLSAAGELLGLGLGVQAVVAEEAVGAARELVGAGLGDDASARRRSSGRTRPCTAASGS